MSKQFTVGSFGKGIFVTKLGFKKSKRFNKNPTRINNSLHYVFDTRWLV
jgi:hypothetical protein